MKTKFFFFLIALLPVILNAQWQLINPLPFETEIQSSSFVDEKTGWVTTDLGEIFKTTDGGDTWTNQYYGNGQSFYKILFINKGLGFAVGWNGLILKTTNGGNNWSEKVISNVYYFESIFFTDSNHGWIVGYNGLIYSTTNSGETWVKQNSNTTAPLEGIKFFNNQIGFATVLSDGRAPNKITKTTDGGLTWNFVDTKGQEIGKTYFLAENIWFTCGSNATIYSTRDSGLTWNKCFNGVDYSWINEIVFSSDTEGWAVGGFDNLIIHTTDGGLTWNKVNAGIDEVLFNVLHTLSFVSEKIGWVFNSGRAFYKTTDAGKTWIKQSKDLMRNDFSSISFLDDKSAFAVAGRTILKTQDGGFTWSGSDYATRSLVKIQFADKNNGWIVGTKGFYSPGFDLFGGIVLKTENGGTTWNPVLQGEVFSEYSDLFFISSSVGWVAGSLPGIAYKTTDNGVTWNLQGGDILGRRIQDLFFIDEQLGFAGGQNLFRTTNGGNTWQEVSGISNVHSIYFTSKENGYALSDNNNNRVYYTYNGGITWGFRVIDSNTYLNKIIFVDSKNGYLISNNAVYYTDDGGEMWVKQRTPNHWYFSDIAFVEKQKGWVVGNRGFIMYTQTSGSGVNPNKTIPTSFSLSQNYPNPFNPSTTIGYQLSTPGFVTLKVYDLLGREVATLVNEFKTAGNYNSKFSTQNLELSSGVYFYRLQSGGYSETKKLILMK